MRLCSAKTKVGVQQAFDELIQKVTSIERHALFDVLTLLWSHHIIDP
jgi:hypothetical protein